MKTYQQFVEDLQSKRMRAKQNSADRVSNFKEKTSNDKAKRRDRITAMKQEYERRNPDYNKNGNIV